MDEEIILNQIIEDAKKEANKVIAEAEDRARKINTDNQNKIMDEAEAEFEIIKSKILKENTALIEKEELIARNAELIERKNAIEIVKEKVKQKIKDLDEAEYSKIIENLFEKIPNTENVEVVLPKKHFDAIKKLAESKGFTVVETDEFDVGFIARCGKIEYNYDFEENMSFMAEEIEKQIDAILF